MTDHKQEAERAALIENCKRCKGAGYLLPLGVEYTEPCGTCSGTGKVQVADASANGLPALPEPWQGFQYNSGWKSWEQVVRSAINDPHVTQAYTAEQVRQAQREAVASLQAAFDAAVALAGKTIDARNAEITDLRAQLAKRAAVEPVQSIDTPEFRAILSTYNIGEMSEDALIAHIDAWGARRATGGDG